MLEPHTLTGAPCEPSPLWARLLSWFVIIGLPAGAIASMIRPASAAGALVPLSLFAWVGMMAAMNRRDRKRVGVSGA